MANKQHYFHCHGCGRPFPWRPGAPIVCSNACRKKLDDAKQTIHEQLTAAGFEAIGNAYFRNGHATTMEEVRHVGLDETLARPAFRVQ